MTLPWYLRILPSERTMRAILAVMLAVMIPIGAVGAVRVLPVDGSPLLYAATGMTLTATLLEVRLP